jgi:LssY-like putative type I secretion system component LssY
MNALALLALVFAVASCATWQAPADVSDAPLRNRAMSATNQGLRVSAAVLSRDESRSMLGTEIDHSQMQPVWVEVENPMSRPMWLLRSGTDPDYFSPLEVAWSVHKALAGAANASIDQHFEKLGFKNPIPAGATRAGILFTHPERGTKLLNVDVLGQKTLVPFTLFLPVPADDAASGATAAQSLFEYPASQVADYKDLAELRAAIERLPCCAQGQDMAPGDPLNVVVVGELEDIAAAMVRRNYLRDTRAVDVGQEVFARSPDVVLRKQAQARSSAAWIRAWRTPVSFDRRPVYIAQAGRPVGGRFAASDAAIVTHADVDEARNLLVQDMMYSGGLDKLGFAHGSGARERGDGLRAVLFFVTRPLSLSDVEILDWVQLIKR